MWPFGKKGEEGVRVGHEEISEKRTTKLGYVLLIIMVIFVVSISETIFSDLSSIPTQPTPLSYCSQSFANLIGSNLDTINSGNYYGYSYGDELGKQKCTFGQSEELTGVAATIRKAYPDIAKYYTLEKQIGDIDTKLNTANRSRTLNRENYDISLQEKQAGVQNGVIDPNQIGTDFSVTNQDVMSLETQKKSLTLDQSQVMGKIVREAVGFDAKYKVAQRMYQTAFNWYRVYVFLLSLLFVLPLFLLSLRKYFTWKRADSPNTIIATAAVVAFGMLLLQVVGMFLYEIIPHRLIELFIEFFKMFAFLRYVLYYGSVFLVIALFGGIVLYIQKKVFSKEAVAIRALKNRKCPTCEFAIDLSMQYCPRCAHGLQSECGTCHQLRFKDLPVCYHCGAREV